MSMVIIIILLIAMMFLVVPYRVKNPPRNFPYLTIGLIAINLMAHLIACDLKNPVFQIRLDVIQKFALVWGASPVYTLLTSMFLHADIFHLAGNMLFLWVFGPPVEDRLKPALYIFTYLLAGAAGHVVQAALGTTGFLGIQVPNIGASGAIFGILGAYWYLYSWSPVCVFYSIIWFFRGTFEAKAFWVIGIYFLLNVISGFRGRAEGAIGGTANFAHVGGALAGMILVLGLQIKRDTSDVSNIKAAQADVEDIGLLSCQEVWRLVEANPEDESLLQEYAEKACRDGSRDDLIKAFKFNKRAVLVACPQTAMQLALMSPESCNIFTPSDLIYIGKFAESVNNVNAALSLYGYVTQNHPESAEVELALFRLAAIQWNKNRNSGDAIGYLNQLLERFPNGRLLFDAEDLRDAITKQIDGMAA